MYLLSYQASIWLILAIGYFDINRFFSIFSAFLAIGGAICTAVLYQKVILEDLTDVRFATEKTAKDKRYEMVSWAFYQFEQFLTYKANLNSSAIVKVPAKYTSQRCPKCGRIRKENRDHKLHLYICDKCGYKSNDDRLASMNIQFLGTLYRSGEEAPQFNKQASAE